MKRHLVMDLLYGHLRHPDGSWKAIEEGLPDKDTKIAVRLGKEGETFAYFYKDSAMWIEKYGTATSHFWCCIEKEPIFGVTHYRNLK